MLQIIRVKVAPRLAVDNCFYLDYRGMHLVIRELCSSHHLVETPLCGSDHSLEKATPLRCLLQIEIPVSPQHLCCTLKGSGIVRKELSREASSGSKPLYVSEEVAVVMSRTSSKRTDRSSFKLSANDTAMDNSSDETPSADNPEL